MRCLFCGQSNVDGGIDKNGNFICVDCVAEGIGGDIETVCPANTPYYTDYSGVNFREIRDSWNKKQRKERFKERGRK